MPRKAGVSCPAAKKTNRTLEGVPAAKLRRDAKVRFTVRTYEGDGQHRQQVCVEEWEVVLERVQQRPGGAYLLNFLHEGKLYLATYLPAAGKRRQGGGLLDMCA